MNKCCGVMAIILIALSPICSFAQADTSNIRKSFDNLKLALLDEDGNKAIMLVDKNTFAFYSGILLKAKTYDSVQVEKLQIFEKILVFGVRFRDEEDNIKTMTDSAFFTYVVNKGMMNKIGFAIGGTELGAITVAGDTALGQLGLAVTPLPYKLTFRLEENIWKVDLSSLNIISHFALKHLVLTNKQTDTEFLISMIRSGGKLIDERILWNPLDK